LRKALENAVEKANIMAEVLNIHLTRVLQVTENVFQPSWKHYYVEYGVVESETPIIPGEFKVTANVQVVFETSS